MSLEREGATTEIGHVGDDFVLVHAWVSLERLEDASVQGDKTDPLSACHCNARAEWAGQKKKKRGILPDKAN
jgi:hypothetical protein